MAIRHYWFVFSAAISAFLATQTPLILSAVIGITTNDRVASVYARLLQSEPVLYTGTAVAFGALLLFLLYFAGLSLIDGVQMATASRRLRQQHDEGTDHKADDFALLLADYPSLETASANYAKELLEIPDAAAGPKSRRTRLASSRQARFFFGPHKTMHPRLFRWFFDPLPLILISVGSTLIMFIAVSAFNQRGDIPFTKALEPGVVSLIILATTGLLIYVAKRLILGVRYQQTAQFCELIDFLYPPIGEVEKLNYLDHAERDASKAVVTAVSGLTKEVGKSVDARLKDWQKAMDDSLKALSTAVVGSLEDSLKKPMALLTDASRQSAEKMSDEARKALEEVLASFLDGLGKNFGKHMKELEAALQETTKAAGGMQKAYQESLDRHQVAVNESLASFAGSFSQTATNFESLQAAVDNLLTLSGPLLRQMISHQEALLSALDQESASSKIIGRAASELSLAAQASRETVEQFVTLAEKLREASKTISSGGGAGARNGNAERQLVEKLRALKSASDNEPS